MIKDKFERSIDTSKQFAFSSFCTSLEECFIKFYNKSYSDIIYICIGTDRSTGDCLGPLVGYKLKEMNLPNVHIFGTLDEPVHAKNLDQYIAKLEEYKNPFIVAIDACLGRLERVGFISIKEGPLSPGAGVSKNLPPVGNINITGIVNIGGFMEIMVLQNTRLSLVMNMSNIIANGIKYNMWKMSCSSAFNTSDNFSPAMQLNILSP